MEQSGIAGLSWGQQGISSMTIPATSSALISAMRLWSALMDIDARIPAAAVEAVTTARARLRTAKREPPEGEPIRHEVTMQVF